VDELTSTTGIVALAAGALALVALLAVLRLAFALRRVRRDQRVVLGGSGADDLVAHAAGLAHEFRVLHDYVEDAAERLHARMAAAEERLDGAVAYRALVRYDAYGEMSGHQSTSIALLDARRNGVVLSSILHREQARLYAKRVEGGVGELELSPEEQEAVRLALEGGPPTTAPTAARTRPRPPAAAPAPEDPS
jgi:asparagine synthetase B (glutamine-hydrolysing)